jgi:hypothetical protein
MMKGTTTTTSSKPFSYQSSIERARRIKAENALSKAAEAKLRPYQTTKATIREETENAQRVFLTAEMKRTALEAFKAEHKDEVLATLRKELAAPAFEAMKREKYGEAMLTLRAENFEKAIGELKEGLREQVKAGLREELYHDVRKTLEIELYDDVRKTLEIELRDEVVEDLRAELRAELRAQLEPIIAAEIHCNILPVIANDPTQDDKNADGYAADGDYVNGDILFHEQQDDVVDGYDSGDRHDDEVSNGTENSDTKEKWLENGEIPDEEDSRGRRRWREGSGPESDLKYKQVSVGEDAEEYEPDPVDPTLTLIRSEIQEVQSKNGEFQSKIEEDSVGHETAPVDPVITEKQIYEGAPPSATEDHSQPHMGSPPTKKRSHEDLGAVIEGEVLFTRVEPALKRKRSREETPGIDEMDEALGLSAKRHHGEDVIKAENDEEYEPDESGLPSFGTYSQYVRQDNNGNDNELLAMENGIGIDYAQQYGEYGESETFEGEYESMEGIYEEIDDSYERSTKFQSFGEVGNMDSERDEEDSMDEEGSENEDDDDSEDDNEDSDEEESDGDEEDDGRGYQVNQEESALRSRGASVNDAIELIDSDDD